MEDSKVSEAKKKKVHQVRKQGEIDVNSFLLSRRCHSPWVTPDDQTVNMEYYIRVLCRLCDAVQCKWPAS